MSFSVTDEDLLNRIVDLEKQVKMWQKYSSYISMWIHLDEYQDGPVTFENYCRMRPSLSN